MIARRRTTTTGVTTSFVTRRCVKATPASTTARTNDSATKLTMLRKTVQNSWYRDAYLYAIWCEAGQPGEVEDPWFFGYSTTPRWMKLSQLRHVPAQHADGIAIQAPPSPGVSERLATLCHTGEGGSVRRRMAPAHSTIPVRR